MILRIITIFGLLFASLYCGIYLQEDPGYVLIMIHHWTIESTFWVAAAVLIILSVLLHTIGSITKNIAGIPRYLREWRNNLRLSRTQVKNPKKAYLDMLQVDLENSILEQDTKLNLVNLPNDLKQDPDVIAEYGRYLIHHHQDQRAEKLIRDCLKINRSHHLITVYSQLNSQFIRIPFIESLLRKEPDSAALHLCLGQVLLAQEMWGSAKTHLAKSLHLHPTAQAYYALGNLLQKLHQQQEACEMYRKGLELNVILSKT